MNIIGARIDLMIDEPWDSSRVIEVKITRQFKGEDGTTYFLVEDSLSEERFIITNRYNGDDVIDVSLGKMLIVAIALPENDFFTIENPDFISHLSYYGIGSIRLSKDQ